MSKLKSLHDLYVEHLQDLHSAEVQLLKALPTMAKAAHDPALKAAFEEHLDQTKIHVERIEGLCRQLHVTPKGETCKAMQGLVEEGDEVIEENEKGPLRDVAIIGAAQRVEHYEIAGYGCARSYAEVLGDQEATAILQRTLDEEGDTDHRLTEIAATLNVVADRMG
jgi:ferritin-like metal-binding protein YciE